MHLRWGLRAVLVGLDVAAAREIDKGVNETIQATPRVRVAVGKMRLELLIGGFADADQK